MALPRLMPGAIDVTDKTPVNGKTWSGGSPDRPKLLLHTIEAADYRVLGWPRDWTRWVSAPHLAMNPARYPDGDWLYQTLPFDKAAYAVRDNTAEGMQFVYQIEIAGQAADVPNYPDQWYQAVSEVAQWFVDEMGVPVEFLDFSCAQYGTTSPCRLDRAAVDAFSGVMGHCHIGRGIDTHSDPGHLDVDKLKSFMDGATVPVPPEVIPPPVSGDYDMKTIRFGDGYNSKGTAELRPTVKAAQIMLASAGFADAKSVDGTCAADGVFGPGTEAAAKAFQKSRHLTADGIIGSKTWAALEEG